MLNETPTARDHAAPIKREEGQPLHPSSENRPGDIRVDLLEIGKMVAPASRVLDIGCGDGMLLYHLVHDRGADARGIEISQTGVYACVARGLSVVQGDADTDLVNYPSAAFDTVILSQTLQAVRRPKEVLDQLLRIGEQAIVSFPNFGHCLVRWKLLVEGRMPRTKSLDLPWYETPNIHLCSIRDFVELCRAMDIEIKKFIALNNDGQPTRLSMSLRLANLFGAQGLFLLRKNGNSQ